MRQFQTRLLEHLSTCARAHWNNNDLASQVIIGLKSVVGRSSKLAGFALVLLSTQVNAQTITLENFEGANSTASGLDNFSARFPAGSSPVTNFNGTSGYFNNATLNTPGVAPGFSYPLAPEGIGYAGLHSQQLFDNEVVQATLGLNGRPELVKDVDYEFSFSAAMLPVQGGPFVFDTPGRVKIFGRRSGTTTAVNNFDATTIENNPNVDLLATTSLLADRSIGFQDFTFNITPAFTYDRLLIVPESDTSCSQQRCRFLRGGR
jgi:hypothetical protein